MLDELKIYDSNDYLQCLECGDIYISESCPNCGSPLAKQYIEDDEDIIQELEF